MSDAPEKNAAGLSRNGSDITVGWSAKTFDITTGSLYYCGVVNFFHQPKFYRDTTSIFM